jgi:hypothetical protein
MQLTVASIGCVVYHTKPRFRSTLKMRTFFDSVLAFENCTVIDVKLCAYYNNSSDNVDITLLNSDGKIISGFNSYDWEVVI